VLAFALAGALQAQTPAPLPNGDELLLKAKAVFRAHERPPYEVYTLERREAIDGAPDFEDSYSLRIWYRRRDRAALSRRVERGRAVGPLFFIEPRFNGPIDPGPTTADIFEPAPPHVAAPARRAPAPLQTDPPTLVAVRVTGEVDYRAEVAGIEDGLYHLRLQPRRDPDRNRLRDLWLERDSLEVRRLRATDRLYAAGTDIWFPLLLTAQLDAGKSLPTIHEIWTSNDVGDGGGVGPTREGHYRFTDVAFPANLPDWYFDPKSYGAHAREAPAY
jgi:hypothetical protein